MAKILITGGTGLVGKKLTKILTERQHKVVILSRNPSAENHYKWDIKNNFIDEDALKGIDYIIHLAGAGIADSRWTKTRKKELLDSRVLGANLLFSKIKEHKIPLKKFISASGIGYYGAITTDLTYKENDLPHDDFISKICIEWEKAAKQFNELNIPHTILRTSVVLAKEKSALQKMNTPLFLSSIGNGKQIFSFIHIEDLCNIYLKTIEDVSFAGIFNAVTPDVHSIDSFTKELGKTLKKPVTPFKIPSFVLNLALGEMASILLNGSTISSKKILKNYNFKYPNLKSCLEAIYNN